MRPPPLSGPSLTAFVGLAESPFTGDAALAILRTQTGINAVLAIPLQPDDEYPRDWRPVPSPRAGDELP
jgi:hypothetical protein